MQKFAIRYSVQENYAAHNEDWDGVETYWKNKPGSTYLVYAENEAEARSVIDLVTSSSNAFIESKEDFFLLQKNLSPSLYEPKRIMTKKVGKPCIWIPVNQKR